MSENVVKIESLIQDDKNFNKGTEKGEQLINKSFAELGAGRSVLLDKDNRIIAGNKSQKAAINAGLKNVRIIETDGTELIAVKRTDVSLDSEKGRKLALADNLTQQVNLAWDEEQIKDCTQNIEGFDLEEWQFELSSTIDKIEKPSEMELKPFTKSHILLSFPVDLHDKVIQMIETLKEQNPQINILKSCN